MGAFCVNKSSTDHRSPVTQCVYWLLVSLSCKQEADESLNFEEQILEAAKSIAAATSALVKAASAAQRELVAQGKVRLNPTKGWWSKVRILQTTFKPSTEKWLTVSPVLRTIICPRRKTQNMVIWHIAHIYPKETTWRNVYLGHPDMSLDVAP